MITLNPGCLCDVCAEEYGPRSLPHSISCGHVLCANCCNNIITKTSTRLTPVCPFCREPFTRESVRRIRIDFGGSGHSSPRRVTIEAPDIVTDIFSRKDDPKLVEQLSSRAREEARRLEHKVARIAAQKSSVEEVSLLHQELQTWLSADVKHENQSSALHLSAALLRAILVNHVSHSEATKVAKNMELAMKEDLEALETANQKLESELRSLRTQYAQKAQECQALKGELTRKSPSSTPSPAFTSSSAAAVSSAFRPRSAMSFSTPPMSPATPGPTSPTISHAPVHHSPLARSSTSSSSRSHSHSQSVSTPPRSSKTPSPPSTRPNSPPVVYQKSRVSSPQPSQMVRSLSADESEKDRVHQRWLPMTADPEMFNSKSSKYATSIKSVSSSTSATSRTIAAAQSGLQPARYGTPVSAR